MELTLVTHVRGTGPSDFLEEYLAARVAGLLVVGHPLVHAVGARSTYRLYRRGSVVEEGERGFRVPELFRYPLDAALTAHWVRKLQGRVDVFIGVDPLNAAAGLFCRTVLRRAGYVVYYAIDFSPQRFRNCLINRSYHLVERLCAKRVDERWDVSPAMDAGRKSFSCGYERIPGRARSKIVPVGVRRIVNEAGHRRPDRLVFVGHLLEKQGLQLVLAGMPKLVAERPDVHLVVIGDGPYRGRLEEQVLELGLEEAVTFTGYLCSEDQVEELLSTACVGLAPYLAVPESFTHYADPGKVKAYLAAGLPVLTTPVANVAPELVAGGSVLVVDAEPEALRRGIRLLLDDPHRDTRRTQAVQVMRSFVWEDIFETALSDVAARWGGSAGGGGADDCPSEDVLPEGQR